MNAERQRYLKTLLPLLAIALLLALAGIGLRSPWPADEPRFAEVAREMVETGEWLVPMRGGEAYPDKPPVFMWATATLLALGIPLKIAFLLPNALCSILVVGLVFDLAHRLWGLPVAQRAAFLLLLAPQFLIQAKSAQIDAMVACWIAIGFYGLMRHFFAGPSWGWYYAAWAFMGLGIITKGVGFLPALLLLPMAYLRFAQPERFRGRLDWRRAAWGPLAMLAVAACWILPMYLHAENSGNPELLAYRDNLLFKQTGQRYVDSWGHFRPWHYFLTSIVPVFWFPLPLLLLSRLKRAAALLKTDPALLATLAWTALVIAFFSYSPGKRGVYILPALPAFALAVAIIIDGAPIARWFNRFLNAFQALAALLLLTFGAIAAAGRIDLVSRSAARDFSPDSIQLFAVVLLISGAAWATALLLWRRHSALSRQFAAMAATWLAYSFFGYPALEPARTPQTIFDQLAQTIPSDSELGLIAFREQFILFSPYDLTHFGYNAPVEEQERNAALWLSELPGRYLLVPDDVPLACFDTANAPSMGLAHRRQWLLLSPAQLLPNSPAPSLPKRHTIPSPANLKTR